MERHESRLAKVNQANGPVTARADGAGSGGVEARPVASPRFEWIMVGLSFWLVGGVYLDGWAHAHLPETLETFLTPWHAVMYSGFFAVALCLGMTMIWNHRKGFPWREAMPPGYRLPARAVGVFLVGGVFDVMWHNLLGIEADVEALLSPPHLIMAGGMAAMVSGPLRSAWRRAQVGTQSRGLIAQLPMLLSLTWLLSSLTFMTQYAHPFSRTWAAEAYRPDPAFPPISLPGKALSLVDFFQIMGILGVLLQTGLLMGLVLLAARRFALPMGSLTLVFGLNAALMAFMRSSSLSTGPWPLIVGAGVAGLVADLLLRWLEPFAGRPRRLRAFAFVVPVILYVLYFSALWFYGGIWWSVPMWAGSIFMAGIAGMLFSYAFMQPRGVVGSGSQFREAGP